MKISSLRHFIKLTEYESFSKLAEDLPISQSTLSHQINQIEKHLGDITLIDRTTRSFELTRPGEIFLEYARKIVNIFDQCEQELKAFSQKEEIKITASTLPGSHILPKYIARFRNTFPNIDFKIQINNSQKSLNLLTKRNADFAGVGSFMNQKMDDFDYLKLVDDNLVLVCRSDHELVDKKDEITLQDILSYPFIAREKGSGTRNVIENQFFEHQKLNVALEMNDNDSIISAVSDSNYISILSEIIARKAEDAGLLKIIELKNNPTVVSREIYLIKLKNMELTPLQEKFWKYLKSESKIQS